METNEAVGDAQAIAVGLGQFRMGRGRGVNRERARVADVRDVGDELQVVDEIPASRGRVRGLETEDDHRTALALEVLEVLRVLRVVLEAGVLDPSDLGVLLEVLRDLHRVLAVTLHS